WWKSLNESWKRVFAKIANIGHEDNPSQDELDNMVNAERVELYVDEEQIKGIDNLEPLRVMVHLKELYCGYNCPVTSLEPLRDICANMTYLDINGTKVKSLDPIAAAVKLETLYASNSKIKSIDPIKGAVKLRYLYLGSTKITNIDAVKEMTRLEYLD